MKFLIVVNLKDKRIRISEDKFVFITSKKKVIGSFYITDEKLKLIKNMLKTKANKRDFTSFENIEYNGFLDYSPKKAYIINEIVTDISFDEIFESSVVSNKIVNLLEENFNTKFNDELKKIISFSDTGVVIKKPILMEHVGYEMMLATPSKNLLPLFVVSTTKTIYYDAKNESYLLKDTKLDKDVKSSKDIKDLFKNEVLGKNNFKLLNRAILNGFENANKSYNAYHKMIVKHVPNFRVKSDLSVSKVPLIRYYEEEIHLNKIIKIGSMQAEIFDIRPKIIKARLIKGTRTLINGEELENNQELTLRVKKIYNFTLESKAGEESWKVEFLKKNFKPELREIHFSKLTTLLEYTKVDSLESYEAQKSLMMFLDIVMKEHDLDSLDELYKIIEEEKDLSEEFITRYLLDYGEKQKEMIKDFKDKKSLAEKMLFVSSYTGYNFLSYPRFFFSQLNYFENDSFLKKFEKELNREIKKEFVKNYFKELFSGFSLFEKLNQEEELKLDTALDLLGVVFEKTPNEFEDLKYHIEKEIVRTNDEAEISYAISRVIALLLEDDEILDKAQELYSKGELKVPVSFKEVK